MARAGGERHGGALLAAEMPITEARLIYAGIVAATRILAGRANNP